MFVGDVVNLLYEIVIFLNRILLDDFCWGLIENINNVLKYDW